ncbi:MAG: hypothetical protein ACRD26_10910 [Vicinamibacterales bacterium]
MPVLTATPPVHAPAPGRMPHERGLGVGDVRDIELVGDNVSAENVGLATRRSLVTRGTR